MLESDSNATLIPYSPRHSLLLVSTSAAVGGRCALRRGSAGPAGRNRLPQRYGARGKGKGRDVARLRCALGVGGQPRHPHRGRAPPWTAHYHSHGPGCARRLGHPPGLHLSRKGDLRHLGDNAIPLLLPATGPRLREQVLHYFYYSYGYSATHVANASVLIPQSGFANASLTAI